ncbi:MAG: pilus assembly protein TadG-related protein [Bacillota bacterium]|uniref:Putative Flp pilus-assembly TadG-like N-terminal domain-containing protein n=1 Tax=Thermanaerosceptrum fracticalcis TaxID=1712410 RepID=A0A7G6E4C0_THEFR|nr:pilus assembly protein TadG-related protein [Thermanaerosceptrum fracticalcis]QNB46924.1 hypothetical protein BR63_11755 [Thermanaerosceptrum fracticalcis]
MKRNALRLSQLFRKMIGEERGSALVLIALALTVLLSSVALVTDVGIIFLNRIQVANAADAAALAGVQALPDDKTRAELLAEEYGVKNNVPDIVVEVTEDRREIKVTAQRTTNLLFARVMGHNSTLAQAQARVKLEPLTGVKGIVPLGIEEQVLIFGETYILKYAAGSEPGGEYHSGWLGILALQGPGAKLYEEDLMYGFDQEVKVGDLLNIQTGNISGKTQSGVQYRIDRCKHTPACTPDHYEKDCPKILLVPMIKPYNSKQVQVMGFAAFLVEAVAGMGNENYITGQFLYHTISGASSPTGPDNGIYAPRLIQ